MSKMYVFLYAVLGVFISSQVIAEHKNCQRFSVDKNTPYEKKLSYFKNPRKLKIINNTYIDLKVSPNYESEVNSTSDWVSGGGIVKAKSTMNAFIYGPRILSSNILITARDNCFGLVHAIKYQDLGERRDRTWIINDRMLDNYYQRSLSTKNVYLSELGLSISNYVFKTKAELRAFREFSVSRLAYLVLEDVLSNDRVEQQKLSVNANYKGQLRNLELEGMVYNARQSNEMVKFSSSASSYSYRVLNDKHDISFSIKESGFSVNKVDGNYVVSKDWDFVAEVNEKLYVSLAKPAAIKMTKPKSYELEYQAVDDILLSEGRTLAVEYYQPSDLKAYLIGSRFKRKEFIKFMHGKLLLNAFGKRLTVDNISNEVFPLTVNLDGMSESVYLKSPAFSSGVKEGSILLLTKNKDKTETEYMLTVRGRDDFMMTAKISHKNCNIKRIRMLPEDRTVSSISTSCKIIALIKEYGVI